LVSQPSQMQTVVIITKNVRRLYWYQRRLRFGSAVVGDSGIVGQASA
jgi:hypothetical protein